GTGFVSFLVAKHKTKRNQKANFPLWHEISRRRGSGSVTSASSDPAASSGCTRILQGDWEAAHRLHRLALAVLSDASPRYSIPGVRFDIEEVTETRASSSTTSRTHN
ncbi:hypothetical protein F443_05887, partial [Phytophthora nicotianae P1569]